MGLFNFWKKKKESKVLPLQKTSKLSIWDRLRKKQKSNYLAECEICYKGTPLSRVTLRSVAFTSELAQKDINANIEIRVSKIYKEKKR